jgi:hypothetical protein
MEWGSRWTNARRLSNSEAEGSAPSLFPLKNFRDNPLPEWSFMIVVAASMGPTGSGFKRKAPTPEAALDYCNTCGLDYTGFSVEEISSLLDETSSSR